MEKNYMKQTEWKKPGVAIAGTIPDNIAVLLPAKIDFKGYFLTIKCETIIKKQHFWVNMLPII